MAARKRSQEEKNLRTLRELASLPVNKQCFDCHQRGPTYVNMTIGSFVCTSCSGMLRGLNPPHRVKSITMTVFTPDEIAFIRSRGNEYCRFVWLGLHNSRSSSVLEPEPRDEQKIKDFLIQKYERKRWYVEHERAVQEMMQERQKLTAGSGPSSQSSTPLSENMPDTKPLSSLLGQNATPLVVQRSQTQLPSSWINPNHLNSNSKLPTSQSQERSRSEVMNMFDSNDMFSGGGSNAVPPPTVNHVTAEAAQTTNSASYSIANGNFANFESAFNESTTPSSNGANGFAMFGQSNGSPFSVSYPVEAPSPVVNPQPQQTQVGLTTPAAPPPSADRYAALADLDSLFHQDPVVTTAPPAPTSTWTGSTSTTATSVNNNNNGSSMFNHSQSAVNALFAAATANPFTSTTPTWSSANSGSPNQSVHHLQQQHPQQQQTANPFQQVAQPVQQNSPQSVMGQQQQQQQRLYSQFGGNPNVPGNPVVIDNFANMGGVPPAAMQTLYGGYQNSPNGMQTFAIQQQQNGGMQYPWGVSPNGGNQIQANTGWPIGIVSQGQVGQVGAFQNTKLAVSSSQPLQVSANPFMNNQVSNALRTNPSNPFL